MQDCWEIASVTIEGKLLRSQIRMRSTYLSPSDNHGFHLTIFTALEFLSQLAIIYGHVWAGYEEKKREGWLLESTIAAKKSIRSSDNIMVEMEAASIRKVGDNIIGKSRARVVDDEGGLFLATLKCFLS
ncbi:MAG: hypothetical protein HQL48_02880 [Gammaproteobacteria bacterium]|nr:hypothetical protein [Gammaproteobacteria bacterium]